MYQNNHRTTRKLKANLNCGLKVDDYREGREPAGTTREQVVGAMALYRWAQTMTNTNTNTNTNWLFIVKLLESLPLCPSQVCISPGFRRVAECLRKDVLPGKQQQKPLKFNFMSKKILKLITSDARRDADNRRYAPGWLPNIVHNHSKPFEQQSFVLKLIFFSFTKLCLKLSSGSGSIRASMRW